MFDISFLAPFALAALVCALAAWWCLRAIRRAAPALNPARATAVAMAISGLAVLGVYLAIGTPGAPGGAYAARERALLAADPATFEGEEWRAYLSAKARMAPTNPEPLFLLGVIEQRLGNPEAAIRAFEGALRRDPELAPAMIELGRTQVTLDQGAVRPRTRALFEAAARRMPDEPLVWFYQALAAQQEGRTEDAARLWRETLARLPAEDPRREMVQRMIAGGGAPAP